jgi:hypothetical protein
VHERLQLNLEHACGLVRRTERLFWYLTKYVLADRADFDDESFAFVLQNSPIVDAPAGRYVLSSQRVGDESPQLVYRLSHPLGRWVLDQAKRTETVPGSVSFAPVNAPLKVTMAEQLAGHSGHLTVHRMVIKGAETEEYLLVSGVDGESASLNPEAAEKLYRWAEDQEKSAEQELDAVKQQIQRVQRESRQATTVDEQTALEEQLRTLDRKKRQLRARIFDIEDQIQARRDELLDKLEARVQQVVEHEVLFTIGWRVEE